MHNYYLDEARKGARRSQDVHACQIVRLERGKTGADERLQTHERPKDDFQYAHGYPDCEEKKGI